MKIPYRYRAGWGFVVLVLSGLLTVAFLAFGFRQPPLDSCWLLQERMKAANPAITLKEATEARACLQGTKGLSESLLGPQGTGTFTDLIDGLRPGFDTLAVRVGAKALALECRNPAGASLRLHLGDAAQELVPGKALTLPPSGKAPLALVLEFTGAEESGCQVVAK